MSTLPSLERELNPEPGSPPDAAEYELYDYTPLAQPNSFRLVRLYREDSDLFNINIQSFALDDHPLYHAVSYTWGCPFSDDNFELDDPRDAATLKATYTAERNISVLCDGSAIYITRNLHELLENLKVTYLDQNDIDSGEHDELTHYYWIDAICINQEDIRERAAQVAMMYDIYASADLVYIWLGPELPHTQKAIDLLNYIYELPEEKRDLMAKYPPTVLADPQLPVSREIGVRQTTREEWQVLYAFLDRNWFRRAWIVQEFVAAPRPRMFCGSTRVYWMHLVEFSQIVWLTDWHHWFASVPFWTDFHSVPKESRHQTAGISPAHISLARDVLREDWSETAYVISSLINNNRSFQATDPRDMVYSSFYLIKKTMGEMPHLQGIVPDYEKPIETVYMELALFIIHADSDLRALTLVADLGKRSRKDLPSWVMDLTTQLYPTCLQDAWHASEAASEIKFIPPVIIDDKYLQVSGVHIDTIIDGSMKCSSTWDEGQLNSWLKLALKLATPYCTSQPIMEVLWRTLITDVAEADSPADNSYAEHFLSYILWRLDEISDFENIQRYHQFPDQYDGYHNFKQTIDTLTDVLSVDAGQVFPGREKVFALLERIMESPRSATKDETRNSNDMYEAGLEGKIRVRRLFVTKNNLLGMAAESFENGDTIWVLAGGDVPFVLRPLANGHYMLIGDAYVHGIMHGEALEDGTFETQEILLA